MTRSTSSKLSTSASNKGGNSKSSNRRQFLAKVVGTTSAAILTDATALEPLTGLSGSTAQAQDIGPTRGVARAEQAFLIRVNTALREKRVPITRHPSNGDENRYPNRIGNYSKGLIHNSAGEVDPNAYNAYLEAISSGRFSDFEALRDFLGCPDPTRQRPFVHLEGANAFELLGTDSAQLTMPPAPAFASAEEASEMVELYWMALLRDVNFDDYATNSLAQEAADDLSNQPAFRGPKENGRVTPQTLFRDSFPGCTVGPYISQFLLRNTAYGAQRIDQRIQARLEETDYMTIFADWLENQNGCNPANLTVPPATQAALRFIRDGRDLSHYVRLDILYQAFMVAGLILLNGVTLNETTNPFLFRFPFDEKNPYGPRGSTPVQAAFASFGNPHIMTLVTMPVPHALKAVWYQKWRVHRRLRPEEFGGRLEAERLNLSESPIHPDLTQRSTVLPKIATKFGSYLLPQAAPEGSPLHASYGSGHAVVAGACITMLKAFFDESTVIQEPLVINPDDGGQTTRFYEGPDRDLLTVGGELNKLASNIATGRNIMGVHWRTDGVEAIKLGERVAISILADMFHTYGEPFEGFSLTKFDGTKVIVRDNTRA
jgi:hypothetical protein